MRKRLGVGVRVAVGAVTSRGSQNFLGAPWVERLLRTAPSSSRESIALWLISLSPHYFYDGDRRAEADRNRTSREGLVRDLLMGYLAPTMLVLDYGCGPGYMASAVAPHVRQVEAVDVSHGVLACARVLNCSSNIIYETPFEASQRSEQIDLAYSFAVVQHLTDASLRAALTIVRERLRPGGTLLLHFPAPDGQWRTEDSWRSDRSPKGRAKLRYGLNCFGRGEEQLARLVSEAGFRGVRSNVLANMTSADADISRQRLLVAVG